MKVCAGVVFLIIFSGGILLSSQQSQQTIKKISVKSDKEQTENEQQKSNTQQSNSNNQMSVLPITEPKPTVRLQQSTENKDENRQQSLSQWGHIFKNPTYVFTGLIAIFTIFLFAVGLRQAAIAKDTERRQLRSYVFIDSIKIGNVADVPPPHIQRLDPIPPGPWIYSPKEGPIVTVDVKNSGKTPAYDMTQQGNMSLREYPLKTETLSLDKVIAPISKCHIPPGGAVHQTLKMKSPLTPDEIDKIKSGEAAIYVYGEIIYSDAFGKKRFTRYRCMHNRLAGQVGKENDLLACKDGNEAN